MRRASERASEFGLLTCIEVAKFCVETTFKMKIDGGDTQQWQY